MTPWSRAFSRPFRKRIFLRTRSLTNFEGYHKGVGGTDAPQFDEVVGGDGTQLEEVVGGDGSTQLEEVVGGDGSTQLEEGVGGKGWLQQRWQAKDSYMTVAIYIYIYTNKTITLSGGETTLGYYCLIS